ncbi:HDA11-like protein, partial [Mya arenaria]
WSMNVAGITEVPPVAFLPNFIVQRKVLKPFRYQTGGTILAAKLAIERGWGINIGGGFHHCSGERGGGFCAYADITLAIKFLFKYDTNIKKAMIVDLDAHQGNGHERDFMEDSRVYIMDVYNRGIYPHDGFAKRAIRKKVELAHGTADTEYLNLVDKNFDEALTEFHPDGIIARDEMVFKKARDLNIPIMMVTSGGYQRSTAQIIADSILNLRALGHIACKAAENCPTPEGFP